MEEILNLIIRRDEIPDRNVIRGVILNDILDENEIRPDELEIERFELDNIDEEEAKLLFRFNKHDIPILLRLLRVPDQIRTQSGYVVSGTEGLCIMLRRLAYPNRLSDLRKIFGRSSGALSAIIADMSAFIYQNHRYLLEDLGQLRWLSREKLQFYSQAISAKGAAVQNCWAFIDGTARAICRPTVNQEEYYSGHKRFHCVKYQALVCPDGIIVSLLGAYPGRRHDAFIFGDSGLYPQLQEHMRFGEDSYVIYGDQAYGIRDLLLCPYPGQVLTNVQQEFNRSMSLVRQAVEWGFQKILSLFAFLDLKKKSEAFTSRC